MASRIGTNGSFSTISKVSLPVAVIEPTCAISAAPSIVFLLYRVSDGLTSFAVTGEQSRYFMPARSVNLCVSPSGEAR